MYGVRPPMPIPAISYPEDLPITARREDILQAIRGHQVVILAGETGSGKTTQLPKMCLEVLGERRGQIGCTQPRRVAAMSVSQRVAEELQVPWGREVGCKMRFNDDTSRETRIKFMTDGILLAEIQSDPLLKSYAMLILDEAHERSLNIDFLLGYLKELLPRRPDLKLLVTSATIDTEAFSKHFGGAPVVEVSGRLYPVEVRYQALSSQLEEQNHMENAAAAVEDVLLEIDDGDVLVFMPTERDIRETRDQLEARLGNGFEVLGLYGRMAAAEQQRIFAPGRKRRVVVATNVAETSVTIPRIRAVVDTGLARMSRYNPHTRTKRLPIEPISQSSANQRAGRAGRLSAGICVRLYSEEDFDGRPKFTQPEIQRANLAEVILRMKAFKLGEIESFPFINPPLQAAITGGYQLLHELGALSDTHEMTESGRELARLPLDPTLGRMLLQARKEKALAEILVIAAGLSVPDPRERPEEAREQAAAAHRAFWCPDSDFLSYLRLWKAAPDPQAGSLNQLRRFCKSNFLSLTRMREWRDIWRQLGEAMRDADTPLPALKEDDQQNDAAIHRCILAGHLSHVALREERNIYKTGGNRQVMVFPGSNMYERREKRGKASSSGEEKSRQPRWIVAGEIVQTSQLFARTIAKIDPAWVMELGAHLLERQYGEPHWHARSSRVLVWERSVLRGLEIDRRQVDYGRINPSEATAMFIRHALLQNESGEVIPHAFYANNQKLRERMEASLTRVRSNRVFAVEEALYDFYANRLERISSLHDLNRAIAEKKRADPQFLFASEADLNPSDSPECDLALFPDEVPLGNAVLPINYNYKPGRDDDGVTVRVPLPMAAHLNDAVLQWMVPGLREEQISVLLRSLPKVARRALMPIDPKVREIATEFQPSGTNFLVALAAHLQRRYGVEVEATDWPPMSLPDHLRPRIEVVDAQQKMVVTDRNLDAIRSAVKARPIQSDAWEKAVRRFERFALRTWSFGDVPETLVIEEVGGVPWLGYPGLELHEGEVNLRLYREPEEAQESSPAAVKRLAELALGHDLAWLTKELRQFGGASVEAARNKSFSFQDALTRFESGEEANAVVSNLLPGMAFEHITSHLLRLVPLFPLTAARFQAMCEKARKELPGIAYKTRDLFQQAQTLKTKILQAKPRYPGLERDLARLVPADLLRRTPHAQLVHLPRYLNAVKMRAERASHNPGKDAAKAELLESFDGWEEEVPVQNRETFRWLLEEYRVSIFAQELGTAHPVSVKRLEALFEE